MTDIPNENEFIQMCQQSNWLYDEEDYGLNSQINLEPLIDITIPPNNTNNTGMVSGPSHKRTKKAQNGTVAICRPKNPPSLSIWGEIFRDRYFALIKDKKRNVVIKSCIKYYHRLAKRQYEHDQEKNNLPQEKKRTIKPFTRDEGRCIILYFNHHACEMNLILGEIEKMQDRGLISYPADYARLTNTSL